MSPTLPHPHRHTVVILGGGIVGLSLARELAGRGSRVTILEAHQIGSGSSAAAVGVLSAPTSRRSALGRLARDGYEMQEAFAGELHDETGIDVGYRECGSLTLIDQLPRRSERTIRKWSESGVSARWIEGEELRRMIPGYGGRQGKALWLDREAVVDSRALIEAIRRSCLLRGVEIRENLGKLRLVQTSAERVAVRSADSTGSLSELPAGREDALMVLAAGCWSSDAARDLPEPRVRVKPVRGQALELLHPSPRCIVHFELPSRPGGYFLVPRDDDRLWVGSTVEDVGFVNGVTEAGRNELLTAARAVLPDVGDEHIERIWSGLRPRAMRRGGPFLGPWPSIRNLWMACGHYRSGILLGPVSARRVARGLLDGEPLEEDFSLAGRPHV